MCKAYLTSEDTAIFAVGGSASDPHDRIKKHYEKLKESSKGLKIFVRNQSQKIQVQYQHRNLYFYQVFLFSPNDSSSRTVKFSCI